MHPRTLPLLALAALATSAAAQPYWTLDDNGNHNGIINTAAGEVAILTVWSTCTSPALGFAESLYSIAGDTNWQNNGTITSYDNLLDTITNDGTLGAGNTVTAIDSFQLPPFFNPSFDISNPIVLYQLVWTPTLGGNYAVSVTSTHTTHDWYSDSFGTTFSCAPPYSPTITFQVVPAPGACAALGLSALLGTRRRRP
ncbi:MAG: hypothetical protein IPJ41_06840 [Phycisphaerales bacterium]|nr:hypothetical protein [Phycisphaerales bacterium]